VTIRNPCLSRKTVELIMAMRKDDMKIAAISRSMNIDRSVVHQIVSGKTYNWATGLPKDEKFFARHRAYYESKFGRKTERPIRRL